MAGALHSNARSIGTRGLNASPVGLARTPRAHQTRLLRETSSTSPRPVARPRRPPVFPATFFLPRRPRASSAPVRHLHSRAPGGRRNDGLRPQIGSLFSGHVSSLDAFSPYRLGRGCPASPDRTTGTLEAPALCSSRTESPLPSSSQQAQ
jgi:hypothetical protein